MAIRKAIKRTYRYFTLQRQKQRALKVIKRYKKRLDKYKKQHQERVKRSEAKRIRQGKTFVTAISNIEKKVKKWNKEMKKL